jgi:HAE1 family hydrophobic/amphiphilic exporter-1
MPGLFDVRNNASEAQPKIDVLVDREAAARRGLDATRIARSVRASFAGTVAATYRDGDEELDVLVRLAESHRSHLDDLTRLQFVSRSGQVVPFTDVARVVEGESLQTIHRHDRQLAVTVSADVDVKVNDIRAVNLHIREYFERIRRAYPSVRLEEGGQFREFTEAFSSLAALFGFGILLNFMLLSGQFKNWAQPLVILAVVPLSFIGATVGLLVSQNPFSIATLYGFVALAGVAVNDSIVLVAFVNQLRDQGVEARQSLIEAGRLRLRPIVLTSVTTIFGLLPMALGLGGASETWQPLATTIVTGLVVATGICLIVIPCLQAILDDLAALWRRKLSMADLGQDS